MGIITDSTVINKIESVLAQVRPFLESDGGDILTYWKLQTTT